MNAPQPVGDYLANLTPSHGRVYLAARRGRVWHWPVDYTSGPAACTGWPVRPATAKNPVSVRIEDRCNGNGCRQQWDQWLRDTVRACLLAEAAQR